MAGKVKVVDLGRKHLAVRWMDAATGRQRQKSTRTSKRKEADKFAGKIEADLEAGRYFVPTRIIWAEFRRRYEVERVGSLAPRTSEPVAAVMNHVERVLRPERLADVSTSAISFLQAKLRREGLKDTTIAGHLAHLQAALRWAKKIGLIQSAPEFEMPPRAKGKRMRGRPITEEEFDRMLTVVPMIRPDDWVAWLHFLRGLWLSGLRLKESLELSWQVDAPFAVDLASGKHPRLRIHAEVEKGHKDRVLPITPDFAEFLNAIPGEERIGVVFRLTGLGTGWQITAGRAGRIVSNIGERAGIVVNKEQGKYASAHDLRRAFGTRWAKWVKPAVLMALMRHETVETTMRYYVDLDADDIAAELWRDYPGKISGGNRDVEGRHSTIG